MKKQPDFTGVWVSALPFDSDDLLAEYTIAQHGSSIDVKAKDLQDNEKFVITDVHLDGQVLQFTSYVPSTKRKGVNRFRLTGKDTIETEFTFTVLEKLKRQR